MFLSTLEPKWYLSRLHGFINFFFFIFHFAQKNIFTFNSSENLILVFTQLFFFSRARLKFTFVKLSFQQKKYTF